MDDSSPPSQSNRRPQTFSPLAEEDSPSPVHSTASSDHTSHGFYSPKYEEEEQQNHQAPIPPPEPTQSSPPLSPVIISNRSVKEQPKMVTMTEVDPGSQDAINTGVVQGGGGDGGGRRSRQTSSALKRTKRESVLKRVLLGFRICGVVLCLISFSVMAADKNQGWALDSFDRYKEFRYCISVNVMGFVYLGAQASDLAYHLATGNYINHNINRYYFDFFSDQVLSYLLLSASSSAATRVEDWESNWGKDKFPQMAKASVALSFLAFVVVASSSLISGYALCTLRSS